LRQRIVDVAQSAAELIAEFAESSRERVTGRPTGRRGGIGAGAQAIDLTLDLGPRVEQLLAKGRLVQGSGSYRKGSRMLT
jgi:hypothetical protein